MIHPYPTSISEAAKLLDRVNPDWAKSIDKDDLQMQKHHKCILGQLYGDYDEGMRYLFGEIESGWRQDSIFGMWGDKLKWLIEINNRLIESESRDFTWALEQMADDKKVRSKRWGQGVYIISWDNNTFRNHVDVTLDIKVLASYSSLKDWEEYKKPESIMVKRGDRVKDKDGDEYIVASVSGECGLICLKTGNYWTKFVDVGRTTKPFELSKLLGDVGDYTEGWTLCSCD